MKILKIVTRNIMCFGNKTIEIDFNEEPSIWELLGGNGVGKSTIIRIIKLGIYGKTDGLTMAEIANDVNGNGYIEIHFESRNVFNKIIRTFTPHSTTLYENNSQTPTDKGGKPALEKYITEQVVDIPYYVFDNVLNLDISSFKSFLTMKPEDARKIRDRIFSFYVLNTMTELLKTGISEINKQIDSINISIANINENIENSNRGYEEAKGKLTENKDTKIAEYNRQLEEQQQKLTELTTKKTEAENSLKEEQAKMVTIEWLMMKQEFDTIENDIKSLDTSIAELDNQKTTLNDNVTLYENSIKFAENKKKQEEIKTASEQLEAVTTLISSTDTKKQEILKSIEEAKVNLQKENLKSKIIADIEYMLSVKTFVTEQIINRDKLKLEIGEIEKQKTEAENKMVKVNEAIIKYSTNTSIYKTRLEAYANNECDRCGSNLTDEAHAGKKDEYQSEYDTAVTKHAEMLALKNKLADDISNLGKKQSELNAQITEVMQSVRNKGNELHKYQSDESCLALKTKITSDMIAIVQNLSNTISDVEAIADALKPKEPYNIFAVKLLEEEEQTNETKLKEVEKELSDLNNSKISLGSKVNTLNSAITPITIDEQSIVNEDKETLSAKILGIRSSLNKLDGDLISNKSNKISANDKLQQIGRLMAKIDTSTLVGGVTIEHKFVIDERIKQYSGAITEIGVSIQEQAQEINKINANIDALNSLSNIEEQLKHLSAIVDGHKEQLEKKNQEYEAHRQSLRYYSVLEYTISDSGIKAFILKDIVPAINNEIAAILSILDVPLNVIFDDEFQPTVTRMGRKANLKSTSTGQKKMMDFAILTAITKIIKMKYGNLNIIFYDEIFSSIEAVNRTILLDIINETFCKKLGVHVWIVNHGHLPSSYFKHILQVKSVNGFSELIIKDPNSIEYEDEFVNSVLNVT